MIKNATEQVEFTKYNLEVHQLCNEPNLRTVLNLLEKLQGDEYEKSLVVDFVKRLQKNAAKIDYAVEQIEDTLQVGESKTVRVLR